MQGVLHGIKNSHQWLLLLPLRLFFLAWNPGCRRRVCSGAFSFAHLALVLSPLFSALLFLYGTQPAPKCFLNLLRTGHRTGSWCGRRLILEDVARQRLCVLGQDGNRGAIEHCPLALVSWV